jgi:hypothetical protein
MSKTISVSPEFIHENQAVYVTHKRKGGPFSKKERFLRRQEVYKLHFEYGHSALKISQMIKTNRHTVEDDIRFWYSKLAKDWQENDIDGWAQKQLNRFESGRTKLLEELDAQHNLKAKLVIRKMIIDLDEKIAKLVLSIIKTQKQLIDR